MNLICGTYFKHCCRHQFTDYVDARTPVLSYKQDPAINNDFVFIKPEFLTSLSVDPNTEFSLVTHNSDINLGEVSARWVIKRFPNMKHWYAQNLLHDHPKISPIPIGIANPKWSHGNQGRFLRVIEEGHEKTVPYYANFNVSTNPKERAYCYEQLGIIVPPKYPDAASLKNHDDFVNSTQTEYLRSIAQSLFTISPDGNGRDCHKTWEALYMRSIPIVTDSVFARKFRALGIPILIIEDWSEFSSLNLDIYLYHTLWGDFNPSNLNFNLFL